MGTVIGIDPGDVDTAYAEINSDDYRPVSFGKIDNKTMRGWLGARCGFFEAVTIEMIASYGMPVGVEVFDTVRMIGRLEEVCDSHGQDYTLAFRKPIKRHFCGTDRAKDSNITQALVDRFTPGARNFGKGTLKEPGWFHGFAADVWAAYAVAVYSLDLLRGRT